MVFSAAAISTRRLKLLLMVYSWPLVIALSGCNLAKDNADAQTKPPGADQNQATAVDVAIAATMPLAAAREYTGTTQPQQEVAIRAQAEGQLQRLNVDVGDRVEQGQTLVQIDDALLNAATAEAAAELASRRTEVSQIQAQVSDAETQVEQTRLQLQQAQSDAARYDQLAKAGGISLQQAQEYRTEANTAAQVLRSAQAKVRVQQQGVDVANSRIVAQQAVVDQQRQRRGYAMVMSPLSGVVLTRSTEPGNLVRVGDELLRLGDFSQAKVTIQVSELDLSNVRLGGAVKVKLDAFPQEEFSGRVTQISPVANSTSRLIPVEMTIPNSTGRVGSGLLARVSLTQAAGDRLVVPLAALQQERSSPNQPRQTTKPKSTTGTLFVIGPDQGESPKVMARSVTLGQQIDGKVQILTGLSPGERFVSRTGKPLKDGDTVRLSILSEK
jgi:HlyD family secretion protein